MCRYVRTEWFGNFKTRVQIHACFLKQLRIECFVYKALTTPLGSIAFGIGLTGICFLLEPRTNTI